MSQNRSFELSAFFLLESVRRAELDLLSNSKRSQRQQRKDEDEEDDDDEQYYLIVYKNEWEAHPQLIARLL